MSGGVGTAAPQGAAAGSDRVSPQDVTAPGLARRMACFVYEGVLLFGVVFISGYLYATLTQQRNAMQGQHGMQAFVFLCVGLYFVWFWTHGGQTVAMKAWHIRLVDRAGRPVRMGPAIARYLLSWIWFLPALATAHFAGLATAGAIFGLMAVSVFAYAGLALLHPQRQFWHDVVCGTRLVTWRAQSRR